MKRIRLISLADRNFDGSSAVQDALKGVRLDVEAITIPGEWLYGPALIRLLKEHLARRDGSFTVFNPLSTELFLTEPDLTIAFSGYRKWQDPAKIRIIPHVWTPIRPPSDTAPLIWSEKPAFSLGFMGRGYRDSLGSRIAAAAPAPIKDWIVGGSLHQRSKLLSYVNKHVGFFIKSAAAFPRLEVLDSLTRSANSAPSGQVDLEERGFNGTESELQEFKNHLLRNTYIICPRGTENYSYRMYEALSYGRIPVIIDTDILLPPEVDWNRVALIVPLQSINRLYDIIKDDYDSNSAEQFRIRQQHAIRSMQRLQSLDWINELAREIKKLTQS